MDYKRYTIRETKEAREDLDLLVAYMIYFLRNAQAAGKFLDQYEKKIQKLVVFPHGYREIGLDYQGYKIRIKPFSTYNIFFTINERTHQIIILRVLKNRQNWNDILSNEESYSF